jgi:hypothetical protein
MNISLILAKKYVGKQWTLDGDDYDGLTWLSDGHKPSESELAGHWASVQAEIQAEKDAAKAKREAALAKLEALGLNQDDLKALGL